MRLEYVEEDEAFRAEVRRFFANDYPRDIIDKLQRGETLSKGDYQRSEKALAAKGWLAINWPRHLGGTGWSDARKFIFDQELERAGALNVVPMGVLYVAPVIYTFGTAEQQQRWLPGIRNSDTFWCQGCWSRNPVRTLHRCAAARCAYVDRGHEEYLVNGVKISTTLAHHADWIFCLLRTSDEARPQQGISFIYMDALAPAFAWSRFSPSTASII